VRLGQQGSDGGMTCEYISLSTLEVLGSKEEHGSEGCALSSVESSGAVGFMRNKKLYVR
jgi:hypothetical protein